MVLSQKLKVLRKKMGLSQLELSEKLLVSRQAVSGWEAGTSKPSVENLQCLSRLYEVSLEDLLDDAWEVTVPADAEVPAKTGEGTRSRENPRDPQQKRRKWKKALLATVLILVVLGGVLLFVWSKEGGETLQVDDIAGEEVGANEVQEFDLEWE